MSKLLQLPSGKKKKIHNSHVCSPGFGLLSKYELNETWGLALYFSEHLPRCCHRSSRYGSCPAEPIFYSSLWSLSDSRASLSALGAFSLPLLSFLISRNDLLLLPHYFSVHLRSQHVGKVTARWCSAFQSTEHTGSVQSEVQGEREMPVLIFLLLMALV